MYSIDLKKSYSTSNTIGHYNSLLKVFYTIILRSVKHLVKFLLFWSFECDILGHFTVWTLRHCGYNKGVFEFWCEPFFTTFAIESDCHDFILKFYLPKDLLFYPNQILLLFFCTDSYTLQTGLCL